MSLTSILAAAITMVSVLTFTPATKGEETSETIEQPSFTLVLGGPTIVGVPTAKVNEFTPGESLVQREEKERLELERKQAADKKKREVLARERRTSNGYDYGYCTYFVASVKQVPGNWGNARNWLAGASRAEGYTVTSEPQVGSIVVTSESKLGHVAIVQSISNEKLLIKEMNAVGWNKVSTRWLPINSVYIRGYIF
jgi:surface antigen